MAALTGHSYIRDRRCKVCFNGVTLLSRTTVCSHGTVYVCGSCGNESYECDMPPVLLKSTKNKTKNAGKTRCKKCKTWFINRVGCPNGCNGSY